MTDNDRELALFLREMQDVAPLQQDKTIPLAAEKLDNAALQHRRQAAQAQVAADTNFLSGDFLEPVDPHEILAFKRDGVQHGVYKNLRMGKYSIDARLDLHRMTVEQARLAIFQFIKDCMAHDIRCALITHGKGEGRQQPALLKSCVAHWLPQFSDVLAFHSAQTHHGASGATYLLLKKSERKRQANWELHQRRR